MHTASAKARQEMMDNIPVHEKVMQGVYSSYAEALQEIRAKDMEIQKNFADRYGIDMKEIFEEYYKAKNTPPVDVEKVKAKLQNQKEKTIYYLKIIKRFFIRNALFYIES